MKNIDLANKRLRILNKKENSRFSLNYNFIQLSDFVDDLILSFSVIIPFSYCQQ